MIAGALAVLGALLTSGFFLGGAWERRGELEAQAAMAAELDVLRGNAGIVVELNNRLVTIEQAYARLQAAVTQGAPSPGLALAPPVEPLGAGVTDPSITAPAWPLAQRGFVTRTFGSRDEEGPQGHPGIDIAVLFGTTFWMAAVTNLGAAELWISFTRTPGNGARHWKDMDAKAART